VAKKPSKETSKRREPTAKKPSAGDGAGVSAVPVAVAGVKQEVPKPPKAKSGEITENELRFAREYAIDHNATRAYRHVFPNCTYGTARAESCKLLAKPSVKAEVEVAEREYLKSVNISAKKVLRELASLAFHDPSQVYEEGPDGAPAPRRWGSLSPADRRIIQSIKIKRRTVLGGDGQTWVTEEIDYKLHPKLDALDKLCKHLGLTNDGDALKKLLEALAATGPADSSCPAAGSGPSGGDPPDGVGTTDAGGGGPVAVPD
jgi:phage terminase small subunit